MAIQRHLGALITLIGFVLAATALLPLLAVDWWWVRMGDFPRLQLLILYLIVLPMLFPFRRNLAAKIAGGLLLVGVGIQVYWIFPYLPIAPTAVEAARSETASSRLRILTANVLQENEDPKPLLDLLRREQPDVVVLCEVNERWMADLAPLDALYSYRLARPLDNTYGIALYTRLDVTRAEVTTLVQPDVPSIDAVVRLPSSHEVRLLAVHPMPPLAGRDTTLRDAELVRAGLTVADSTSAIVLGDFNDVGWSRTTHLFQSVSGLLDPRHGRGLFPTFSARSPILRYPLDHLFHSDDFRVAQLRRLGDIGSDHFPFFAELSHEPRAATTQAAPALDADDVEETRRLLKAADEKRASGEDR